MNGVIYKGYEIRAIPHQLADSGEWTVNLVILKHCNDQVVTRPFSASDRFKSRDEAIKHCFIFGQQVIAGKAENCTVADL